MAQLRQDYDEFVKRDAEVLVIGPEDEVAFVRYWEKESLPFVGLPDPEHTVLRLYGQEIKLFKMGRMPAQVIVDRQGQARYVHYGHEISEIPPNEELLALLDGLNRGSTFRSGSA
jgi:peroxiredoxin Q/BCP